MVKIVECPRDAMQGISRFIPTTSKVRYLNQLLKCGFDTLDFGSFVSPTAIPQMRDTYNVLEGLNESRTKLLAIVANKRGGDEAFKYPEISYLGYPLSISEIFQKRNTNSTIEKGIELVRGLSETCSKQNKKLVVYLSMAFGNPYGEDYSENLVVDYMGKLSEMGINIVSIADTIGSSSPEQIKMLLGSLIKNYPNIEIGAHLHTTKEDSVQKILALKAVGCQRIDGAILGYGGCPMAKDDLTGNMPTEELIEHVKSDVSLLEIKKSIALAKQILN